VRTDQAGEGTFPEFFAATWRAGVVRYDVDFTARNVTYNGCNDEEYVESYPAVEIDDEWRSNAPDQFHGKYFVPILYRDPAFDAFDDFGDLAESVS